MFYAVRQSVKATDVRASNPKTIQYDDSSRTSYAHVTLTYRLYLGSEACRHVKSGRV